MNNCTRPPHFPPHCGCPAGHHDPEPTPVVVAAFRVARISDGLNRRLADPKETR